MIRIIRICPLIICLGMQVSCDRVIEVAKFSPNIELFGFGGNVDQSKLVKEKTLPTFTGREKGVNIKSLDISQLASETENSLALDHFHVNVREALLLKRELFEAKLKVFEKDAEVQAAFSDYSPKVKLGTTNNYVLYQSGDNTRMSRDDFMDVYLKMEYPFLDYGRREISTQIAIFEEQYQFKDLAIKVNDTSSDLVKIYLDYNSLVKKKYVLEEFKVNVDKYVSDAEERFAGGVSNLSEVTLAEQARTRHNARIVSFNQRFSKAKIQYSENFLGVTTGNFDSRMLGTLASSIFRSLKEPIFKLESYSLEESLLAIEQIIANFKILQHRANYLPKFTSIVEGTAYDVDRYDGDWQVSLNLAGEFGLYDGGESGAKITALKNKADSVKQRQLALHKDLEARLSTLKGEIEAANESIKQSKQQLEFHKKKLSEALERSEKVSFNLSELVSADENILDSTIKLIDQEADLENLWAEVLNIHGIFPDLFKISFDDIGK